MPVKVNLEALREVTLDLTAAESALVRRVCAGAAHSVADEPLDSRLLHTEAEMAGCSLPGRLLRSLSDFRRVGNAYGTLLIRNLPVDDPLPPTPDTGEIARWQSVPVTTIAQLATISRLGDSIAYADEKGGRLVQDVVPIKGADNRQENSGTTFLELHTEDGFHPFKPDFISLVCLRPDHEGVAITITCGAHTIIERISPEDVDTLRQPVFRIQYASSFASNGTVRYSRPIPVIAGPARAPELIADMHAMEPLTPEAEHAFDELRAAIGDGVNGALLRPGDMLFVDNRVAVHGRTAFTARYDGTDRWLRRCFAVSDLFPSRGFRLPGSGVCAPLSLIGEPETRPRATKLATVPSGAR